MARTVICRRISCADIMKRGMRKKLLEILGKDLLAIQDIKSHMEEIKIYMRGHNLYDIFYGKYKGNEEEILKRYIYFLKARSANSCSHYIYY